MSAIRFAGTVTFPRRAEIQVSYTRDEIKLLLRIVDPTEVNDELNNEQMVLLQKISKQHDSQFKFVHKYDTENPKEVRKTIGKCKEKGESIHRKLAEIAVMQETKTIKANRHY